MGWLQNQQATVLPLTRSKLRKAAAVFYANFMVFKSPFHVSSSSIYFSLLLALAPPAEVPKPPPSICENFCLKTRAENHPRNQAGRKISEAETLTQNDSRSFPVSG